jgi:hypothetical protein
MGGGGFRKIVAPITRKRSRLDFAEGHRMGPGKKENKQAFRNPPRPIHGNNGPLGELSGGTMVSRKGFLTWGIFLWERLSVRNHASKKDQPDAVERFPIPVARRLEPNCSA